MQTDTHVYFWKPNGEVGWCGNWYYSPFKMVVPAFQNKPDSSENVVEFITAEHALMWHKAWLMGDWVTADRILHATSPSAVKKLGRCVKPWDEAKWVANRSEIMYNCCFSKFSSIPILKEKLLATGNRVLVEASPLDKIWGIGLDPIAASNTEGDETKWKGLNLLGKVLMKVRKDLK